MEKIRCPGCMKEKQQRPVCEHCGYNENVPNYSHQLPVGTVLHGQYTVGKALGQGGFGITYIGWDTSLQAPIAIKEYYPNSFVSRECAFSLGVHCAGEGAEEQFRLNRERFLREARILAKLSSVPGIVRVQNLFEENNTAYIVMEYVEGIDLKHYIRMQNRVLTVEETLFVMRPILYALHKVHEAELVHRDISPDNIMILPDGTAKLLDFGAAREVADAQVDKELPQSTEAILKHGFAPMEQYRRRGTLGPWTDVYALCATMYYCLTGKVPNSAPERIMGDDNVNWRQIPGLTEQQIQTLEKGLALLPENRIRTMRELHNGLFGQTATGFTQVKKEEPKPEPNRRGGSPTLPKAAVTEQKKAQKKPDYPTHTVSLESDDSDANRRGGSSTLPKAASTERKKKKPFGLIAAALAVVAAVGVFALKPKGDGDIAPTDKPVLSETEPAIVVTLSEEEKQYLAAEELEAAGEYGKAAIAFGKLGDYEDARERSLGLWKQIVRHETIPTNWTMNMNFWDKPFVALRNDGTVASAFEEVEAVSEWTDIVAVECCSYPSGCFVIGLKADGTVVSVTNDDLSDLDTSTWTDIVAIDAKDGTAVGLRMDGTVVASGLKEGNYGQCDVSGWSDIVDVRATGYSTIGLRADGTVVGCGIVRQFSDWSDIVSISAVDHGGSLYGIRSDGTVLTTRALDVSEWTDIVAVHSDNRGDNGHIVGLKSDGTVVAVGPNNYNVVNVSDWTDIIEVYTTGSYTVGLKSDGTVVATGLNVDGCLNVEHWTDIAAIRLWYGCTVGLRADGTVVWAGKGHNAMQNWIDIRLPAPRVQTKSAQSDDGRIPSDFAAAYAAAEALEEAGEYGKAAIAFGKLAGYEDARERSLALWNKIMPAETISAGQFRTMAVKTDGTVLTTDNTFLSGSYVAVSDGSWHYLGLRANGTIGAGTTNDVMPGLDNGPKDFDRKKQPNASNWSGIKAISAGDMHTLGLCNDGTVIAIGDNNYGRCKVDDWENIQAVSAGFDHSVGLLPDGTVLSVGGNKNGLPDTSHWKDIVAISAGKYFTVGLQMDGTVVAAGENESGQCETGDWKDIIAISAGNTHTVALRLDGTVVAVGGNEYGQCDVSAWRDIVAVDAGGWHTVGLKSDGTLVAVGHTGGGRCDVAAWKDIKLPYKETK